VRTLRGKLVLSSVLLTAAVMLVLVVGTQVVLELTARRDVRAALHARPAQAAAAYDRSERWALGVTGALGILVVVLVGLLAWSLTRRALEPVQQMAERATDWSEHDLSHRFDLGPPVNELAALGATLDHLLDRVAQAIMSEQRLTAELAHELRTPLTAITASAEIAQLRADGDPALREDLAEIADGARRMSQAITTLLEVARTPESRREAERSSPGDVVASMAPLVQPPVRFSAEVGPGLPAVAAPADLVVRALTPLVENAARHAASSVVLSSRVVADRIEIEVRDDGGGVPVELREQIFEPGTSSSGGTGLGLGIARRVARSVGGDVVLSPAAADSGTTTFVLRLPRA
jgi:two-component system, OmpR family, sensor kinase